MSGLDGLGWPNPCDHDECGPLECTKAKEKPLCPSTATHCLAWRDPVTNPPPMTGRILVWLAGIGPHLVNVSEMSCHFWDGQDDTAMTSPDEWDWWAEIAPPDDCVLAPRNEAPMNELLTTLNMSQIDTYKTMIGGVIADPYRIARAYDLDPVLAQAVKKLLRCGRKHKSRNTDVREAITTLERWEAMAAEDSLYNAKEHATPRNGA